MKKLIQIFAFFYCVGSFGQSKIAQKIQELNAGGAQFVTVTPFSINSQQPNSQIEKTVAEAQLVTLQTLVTNNVVSNAYETIRVQIPYHNRILNLQLYKVNLFANGFHVDTDKQKNIEYTPGVYYKGIIEGESNSLVSFNFFKGEVNGVISSSQLSNLVVGKIDRNGNTNDYIIYEDQKMKVASTNDCHTSDDVDAEVEKQLQQKLSPASVNCVATYFEIDNNLFVANGSSTTTTMNWMTSVFNNMQTLYANDGITVSLKSTYIWTTPDPYEGIGSSSSDYLYKFKEVRPVFDGDVGQLVGIDPGGLGGVSMGIGGLCTANNYVYSDVSLSYSSVPTYSWTIQVVTHEFGHNVGSRHTHACAWNGNNTAIDNCAPYAMGSTAEGYSCMTTPATIPSSAVKGSIMSYCHLVSGVGISFNNGFGPQPSAAILNFVNSRGCLSTNCTDLCINGIAAVDVNYNVASTSADISWTDITTENAWQVMVTPFAVNFGTWYPAVTNNYTATPLSRNTYYKFHIKPDCGSMTPATKQYMFLTSANYCNGITITDTGGTTGGYTNDQSFVRTLIPNLANNKIKLTVNSFSLEQDYDFFYVYNGSSTSATSFNPAGYTGTTIPATFESTAPDGALTIRFFSDGGVTAPGWSATTSCLPNLGIDEHSYIDYAYYPNPTNGIVTINAKNTISEVMVYNVEGRLLLSESVNNLTTNVDISTLATGTYFFRMKVEGQTVQFKVFKN